MKKKAINLSDRFFMTNITRYAEIYRETRNVIELLECILEGISESVLNRGICRKVSHDLECYFFDYHNNPINLKINQNMDEEGLEHISFEITNDNNTFFISSKKLILVVQSGNWSRKLEYDSKKPTLLVMKDYFMKKKKKIQRGITISTFDENGYEKHRISKHTLLKSGKEIFSQYDEKKLQPIYEVSEWSSDERYPEQVIITECDVYPENNQSMIQNLKSESYFLNPQEPFLLDNLYNMNGRLKDEDKELYYSQISYYIDSVKQKIKKRK